MPSGRHLFAVIILGLGSQTGLPQDRSGPSVRSQLAIESRHIPPGAPIWVTFSLENLTDNVVVLAVPATDSTEVPEASGLPLEHVFSGPGFRGLTIRGEQGQIWDTADGYHPPPAAPTVAIAPHGTVGCRVEISQYYPILRYPGLYRLRWEPYGASVPSNELFITVAHRKQAIIWTDKGTMTLRFFYDQAPNHVENFIELAKSGFYDNLTFHRIVPGYCIMGGDPRGDGTGIRADGKKLAAEFNSIPQDRGKVSMSLLDDDPDSASCQFFITNTRVPEWDGRYTVFAEVVGQESLESLDKLMATEIDVYGTPVRKLYIRRISVVNAPESTAGE